MTALVFGLWDQNINYKNIVTEGTVLCWAAKWYKSEEILFDSIHQSKPKQMMEEMHKLLDEADAVVTYNGINFDHKHINSQFLLHKMHPPSAYKQIDLLRTMRRKFKFPSNKLDYVTRRLEIGEKEKHEGMELWQKCMAGDDKAWKTMRKYNEKDVLIMEETYTKLLPWISSHPNHNLFTDNPSCANCGSESLQSRGSAKTITGTYKRFQCQSCGSWSQGTKTIHKSVQVKSAP
jgi:DNA polymerase elongation subunit (family B)